MSQKILQTRIGLKYDLYANWIRKGDWSHGEFTASENGASTFDAEFVPLRGETIFYYVPAANTGAVVQEPALLFKVGDGTTTLKNLPWGSAIAADVYSWAKNQSLLGGTSTTSGGVTTWTWSQDQAYAKEQDEVRAFIKEETSNIKIKVAPTSAPAGQTGDHWYQTYVSQDGGSTWEATGDPFQVQIDAYTAGSGLNLSNNEFSVKTKQGGYIQNNSHTNPNDPEEVIDDGIDVVKSTVTYTAASGNTPAGLTATSGLIADDAITPIKNYIDAKASESVVSVAKNSAQTTTSGYAATYTVFQNGTNVGVIDIPKDFLVRSATVSTVTAADKGPGGKFENNSNFAEGDKYIDFYVNTIGGDETADHIYLNVKDLVDVYNVDNTAYIQMALDSSNVITATAVLHDIATAHGDIWSASIYTVSENGEPIATGSVEIAAADGVNPVSFVVRSYTGSPDATAPQTNTVFYTNGTSITAGTRYEICTTSSSSSGTGQYIEFGTLTGQASTGLADAADVRRFVEIAVASATPNIQAGNGISVTASGNNKTVAVNLDDTNGSPFSSNTGSGLTASASGLKIDDALTFVLFSGGASENTDNITVAYNS